MRILVTGGAGFIGSHLVERLLAEGWRVRVLDDLSTGNADNLAAVRERVELVEGDVRDEATAARACDGVDTVFHLAAVASVQRSIDEPVEAMSVNALGTLAMLEAARQSGARRFVLASTAAVYGSEGLQPRREDMAPAPESPYAIGKLASEQMLAVYGRIHGMETVALRFFNVFGPRQDPASPYSGVLSIIADRLATGRPMTVFGDGGQTRDFVPVANVVEALVLAATVPGAAGGVFNVGTGAETTLNEAIATLERAAGRRIAVERAPARAGDVRRSVADISLIREALGYRVVEDFAAGCRRLIADMGAGER